MTGKFAKEMSSFLPNKERQGIPHYIFKRLAGEAAVAHGIFTVHGGVSADEFRSLNVSFAVGDQKENVRVNRERIKEELGFRALVAARQVHGNTVRVVTEAAAGDLEIDGVDALLTDVPGLGLMIQQADCQAVLLYDPANRAVANIHAGWRGSVAGIIAQTVRAMTAAFGTAPADLLAAVSPALGPCCAEFVNYRAELPEALHGYQVTENHFDFWAISRDQLIEAGARPDRIAVAGECTVCNSSFFSYRRDRRTGRFASVIGLR